MRILIGITVFALLTSCRGEPVPRDYQNNPPAMTNPADDQSDAPDPQSSTVHPEPSYGVEGTSAPYEPATATQPEVKTSTQP